MRLTRLDFSLLFFSRREPQFSAVKTLLVMVVDGDAKIASFLVDGVLLDGSDELGTGFAELAPLINQDERQSALGHEHVNVSHDCMVALTCGTFACTGASVGRDSVGICGLLKSLRRSMMACLFERGRHNLQCTLV